ncbi:galanin receptor 2b-like [Argopecten irradians]|uniref:galanin receptor 2b-like n=1 Tax=Argopecten irradians TaxID=31199 RepID=UPI0037150CD6
MATHSANGGFSYECILYIPVIIGTVLGIPGTLITMRFYVKRIKSTFTSTPLFLTCLAVFDMVSLITNIPLVATSVPLFYIDGWKESTDNSIVVYVSRIPKYWSNMVLLFIGVERVVSVLLPHRMKDIFTRRVGVVSITTLIIVGPVVTFPLSIEPPMVVVPSNGTITHVRRKAQTLIDPDVYRNLISISSLFYFGIPIVGVLITNLSLVIVLLYRFKSKRAKNSRTAMTSSQMKELRTTKLVMIVTVIFIVCVFPLVIIFPVISYSGESVPIGLMLAVRPTSALLETVNYSMNAVVYYIGSSNFRSETREIVSRLCCLCKRSEISPLEESNTR